MQRRLIERQLSCSKAAILWIIVWNRTDPQARQLWIQTTYLSVLPPPKKSSRWFPFSFNLEGSLLNKIWNDASSCLIKLSENCLLKDKNLQVDLLKIVFSIEKTRKKSKTHLKYRNIYPFFFYSCYYKLKLIARSIITWDIYWSVRVFKVHQHWFVFCINTGTYSCAFEFK